MSEDEDQDDDELCRVALCPLTPELADQLVGLARAEWTDRAGRAAAGERLLAAGWRPLEQAVKDTAYETVYDMPDADLVSPHGHLAYWDEGFSMPFSYLYVIEGELLQDDYWGMLPGWHSEPGAWREEFDAHAEAGVRLFSERLGPPHFDIRQPRYDARHVAWRLDTNVLVIEQSLEPISYYQFEHTEIFIGSRTDDGGSFPGGPAMRALITS